MFRVEKDLKVSRHGGQLNLGLRRINLWGKTFAMRRPMAKILFVVRFQECARQKIWLPCTGARQIVVK
jgi:hypothetical protein